MSRIRLGTNLDMSDAREPTILLTCLHPPRRAAGRPSVCEILPGLVS
jgi:hypothetical protein